MLSLFQSFTPWLIDQETMRITWPEGSYHTPFIFIHSVTQSFIHSLTHLELRGQRGHIIPLSSSFIPSLNHSFTHSLTYYYLAKGVISSSFFHSLTHSLRTTWPEGSSSSSFIPSINHSLIHSLTYLESSGQRGHITDLSSFNP